MGDAAGQVKVTTVGGVVTGLRGARAAAEAILRGSDDSHALRALAWELELHHLVRQVLNHFTPADYDALLELVNRGMHDALGAYTRDEIARVLFSSLLVRPQALVVAARAVLRSAGLAPAGGVERRPAGVGLRADDPDPPLNLPVRG